MKLIQHINGVVVDIRNVRTDADLSNLVVIDKIPPFEPKEGFNGILKYNAETGVYWDYEEAPVVEDEATETDYQNALQELGVTL